jgi:trans-aconitate methyltransferase
METPQTAQLHDLERSIDFYEARYEHGYMEDYPAHVKARILAIIRDLGLPERGEALDFGCGNGVLTDVIRQALPAWTVFGTDLSATAIANASARFPQCTFLAPDDPRLQRHGFDFLFSHHVIEHVFDVDSVLDQMNGALKPKCFVLHMLPCGNAGSYEHELCALRRDGINRALEDRFFFEDEGHLRRLTTDRLRDLCAARGLALRQGYYANQYHGAVEWLTSTEQSNIGFLLRLTDLSQAVDRAAAFRLLQKRLFLVAIAACRLHAEICSRLLRNGLKGRGKTALAALTLLFYAVTRIIDARVRRAAETEWRMRKLDPHGSEMALYFARA